jgi:hypothetical protein
MREPWRDDPETPCDDGTPCPGEGGCYWWPSCWRDECVEEPEDDDEP